MKDKIKILFEELSKKYPEILDENFVNSIVSVIEDSAATDVADQVAEKLEEAKKEAVDNFKKTGDDDDEDDDEDDEDDEEVKESIKKIIDTLDIFCEEGIKQFISEHGEKIDESIKTNVSADVISKLTDVLEGHGISIDGSGLEESASADKTIKDLNKTVASLTEQLSDVGNADNKVHAISIVENHTTEMTEDQKDKFIKLIGDYDIDNIVEFESKVQTIADILEYKVDEVNIQEEITVAADAVITPASSGVIDDDDNFLARARKNYSK